MEKISRYQLFCLVMIGQIGSTNLWALGIEAKQDAWLVVLLSMLAGFGLIWIFLDLQSKFPEDNLAGISINLLGKWLGWPLGLLYVLFYGFNATRNASEFGDLVNMTFLQDTPRTVIIFIFLATIIYILALGIETLARITEIILPVILFLIISIYIMVITSGRVDLKLLTPFLGHGWGPILQAIYPVGINFPFGLALVYMQFWHYTDNNKVIRPTTLWAVGISGILLTITLIMIITTLGTNLAAKATIPFLEVIKLINIGDIITNLDAVGVILIFVGGFYLAVFHFFAATLLMASLFKIDNYRWLLIPLAAFILWYTGVYEPNYPTHVKYLLPQYWQQFVPLVNITPLLLLVIYWLKTTAERLGSKP